MTDELTDLIKLTRVDWLLTAVYRTGCRSYPFRVEGRNLNIQIGHYGDHFSWRLPNLNNHRFFRTNPHIALACKQVVEPLLAAVSRPSD